MENSRLKALLKLLTTEADTHGAVLRSEIAAALKENPAQVQTLLAEEFSTSAPLPVLHTLEEIFWEELAQAFGNFSAKINPDLEEGLLLLAKFADPSTARNEISRTLDTLAHALRPVLLNAAGYASIVHALNHYFFDILAFRVQPVLQNFSDLSFASFLQKRRGPNLCLACLYVLIGSRYGMDIGLTDLAGRILVCVQDPVQKQPFFVDPLDNGKILTLDDCRQYIQARQLAWSDEFIAPLSSRQIVRRSIASMIFALNKVHDERRLTHLRNYLEIIR